MKVSELIEKLKDCPQDVRIVAPGYEDGFDDVLDTADVIIKPNAHAEQWFYGLHDHLLDEEPGSEKAIRLLTSRRDGDDNHSREGNNQ